MYGSPYVIEYVQCIYIKGPIYGSFKPRSYYSLKYYVIGFNNKLSIFVIDLRIIDTKLYCCQVNRVNAQHITLRNSSENITRVGVAAFRFLQANSRNPPQRIGRIWVHPSENWQILVTHRYIYVHSF